MKENMEDGEIEVSDNVLDYQANSLLDDLLRNAETCTHTHTCNPPTGPDAAHTHTCLHTHTHVIPPPILHDQPKRPRRPLGNREAVKRYREKKKAHAAYLEEEVKKLRLMNQLLMGKLQKQALLETEIVRLRTLLLDLRGKIDLELGDPPFGEECTNSVNQRECGVEPNNLACNFTGSSNVINTCGETMAIDCGANLTCLQESLVSSSPQEGK